MEQPKEVSIAVSPKAIVSLVLTLLGLWLLYLIHDIITLFIVVTAVVVVLSPIIKSWERYIPRTLAIIVLYVLVFVGALAITALIIPPVLSQLSDLLGMLQNTTIAGQFASDSIARLHDSFNLALQGHGSEGVSQLFNQFQGSLGAVYTKTIGLLGGVVATVTVFVTSFYLLMEEKNVYAFIQNLLPFSQREKATQITDKINDKMGNWLRGQLILMIIVGLADGIGLAILGVPYALLLGLWAGFTELFPYLGPWIGGAPGVVIAFATLGWVKGLIAFAIYMVVQQLESQFLVPKIMGKALGLSPVTIIFALLIGGKLLGLVGLLIAIPVTAILSIFYEEWRK